MIATKQDLYRYIEADRKAYGKALHPTIRQKIVEWLFPDYNLRFMKCLRKLEYYENRNHILKFFYHRKHSKLRYQSGIELNVNVAGPGLHITHGKVVVSSVAKLGENCKIMSDVTIGGQGRYDRFGAPVIGNRVFIGSGARIIGNISIADDVVIGANAVVVKSIEEPGVTVAGNPARIVSRNDSYHYLNR